MFLTSRLINQSQKHVIQRLTLSSSTSTTSLVINNSLFSYNNNRSYSILSNNNNNINSLNHKSILLNNQSKLPILFNHKQYCTLSATSSSTLSSSTSTNQPQPQQEQQQQQTQQEQKQQQINPNDVKKERKVSFMRKGYFNLVKFPISIYVTFTAVAGYVMTAPIIDPMSLSLVSAGTFLASASASAYNQEMEVQFDAKMPRTKSRPLVTGEITRDRGFFLALASSVVGCCVLVPVHPLSAGLAMSNILLYILYTQSKRTTPWNTWIGAIVGAIPPLIGSVAGAGSIEPIGMLLATVLYIWQIPHFLALAEKLKHQYSIAGYKMLSVTHPHLNYPVSLSHAIVGAIVPFAFQFFYPDLNMSPLVITSFSLSSLIMAYEAILEQRFKKQQAQAQAQGTTLPPNNSMKNRGVFMLSLLMLPLSLIIGMIFRLPYEYYFKDEKTGKETIIIHKN